MANLPAVQVIAPGLFGPVAATRDSLPATPTLDRLLARAGCAPATSSDPDALLMAAFGISLPADATVPSAALSLWADDPRQPPEGYWLHADPIHLRPDRDQLLLFAGPSLQLSRDEADALVQAFNRHFHEDALVLHAPRPGRWYLHVPAAPLLTTRSVHAVNRRAMDRYLPVGADARRWIAWINEAQMLFYGHPVNEAREREGRPAISGVWTWGGGTLPRLSGGTGLVIADHPLAVGLARAAGSRRLPLDEANSLLDLQRPERTLVYWDELAQSLEEGDARQWSRELDRFEELASRLSQGLTSKGIGRLSLAVDGQTFELTGTDLRKFWRNAPALRKRLELIEG